MDIKNYVKLTDFAKRIGISRQSVLKAIKAGYIKEYERIGRLTLIHLSEAKKYRTRRAKA